ncbi:MAG: hypothetical protein JZU60_01770 [Ilumatobacteraceae bacterium]|nr:hypothetical protein [Ilumatobacteraceae bacterium]
MPTTLEQPAPSFADVWRMFQETDRKFQETERLMKERSLETERQMKETALQIKETDRQLKERSAANDEIIRNLSKRLGDIGNRLGEFVEHMVAPAVVRLFQAQGVEVHEVHPGVEANRNGEKIEIDLLVVNDGSLVAVECKSKLTLEYVDAHLKRMEKLKRLLPAYKNHQALGAVAAMVMSDVVRDYALQHGLFVLRQNGDSIEIGNPEGFTPAVW